jgi:AcrR family transcriptional regulator
MEPQKGLRERKNAEAKKALYLAAMKLFRKQGFDGTTVDEIVEKAGFSRATFFNHFGTKQGVLRFYGQELQSHIEELIQGEEQAASPLELIREVIFAMAQEAATHLEEVKLIFTYSFRDPDYLFGQTPARKRAYEILTELVARAQEQGQIRRDISAPALALHILFLYQGVIFAMISGKGNLNALLQSAWQFILGGIHNGNSPA